MVGHFSHRLSSILLNQYFNIDCNEDENNNNANSVYGEATCHWNYTILQNSHRKSGLFILKKVNHGVNGKTHGSYDLSVACFNDSKEGAKIYISVS